MTEENDRTGAGESKEDKYRRLRDWIIYSELSPGTALNERDLAQKLGISRTPLRELLQRLHYAGLVDWEPNKGIFVAPIDYLRIREIFEVRVGLERTAVSLATARATPAQLDELEAILNDCCRAAEAADYGHFIALDAAFHAKIREIADNSYLTTLMDNAHNVALRFWYLYRKSLSATYHDTENLRDVLDAMRARDSARAADAISAHVIGFLKAFHDLEIQAVAHVMYV
jgi:DNA-binding GntR family transcriptional regulator